MVEWCPESFTKILSQLMHRARTVKIVTITFISHIVSLHFLLVCFAGHLCFFVFGELKVNFFCFQAALFSRSASVCPSSSSNRRSPASASVPAGTRLKTRVQRVPPPLFLPQHRRNHQSPLPPHPHNPQSLHILQPLRLLHAASPRLPPRWVR